MENKEIDIFLIHGTFAKKAEWVKDQSLFCQKLKENVDGEVRFHQYHWDGKNSFKSRYKEGEKLGQKVENLENKESIKVLIGHSHGGNIGLYSLTSCDKIDLAVTLGTPFIISKIKQSIKAIDNYTKTFCIILLAIILSFLFDMIYKNEAVGDILFFGFINLVLLGGLLLFYFNVKHKVVDIVKSFKKEIEYIRSMDVKIVNVQYDFDEANFFLNFVNEKIRPISKSIYYVLTKLNNLLFAVIFFMIFLSTLELLEVIVYDSFFLDVVFTITILLLIPILLFIIFYFPISLLINGLSFNRMALGSYPMYLTFFLKIEVSKHLNNILDTAKDYLIKQPKKSKVGLNHSMYYLDPNVANIVAKEINKLSVKEHNEV